MSITKQKLKKVSYFEDEKSIKWMNKNLKRQKKSDFIRQAIADRIKLLS